MAAVERVASLGRVGGEAVLGSVVDEAEGLAAARLLLGRLLHLHLLPKPEPNPKPKPKPNPTLTQP